MIRLDNVSFLKQISLMIEITRESDRSLEATLEKEKEQKIKKMLKSNF